MLVLATAAPRSNAPNILLFFPDELRYDWGGLYNNPYYTANELPLKTPHFDALAARGTRFSRAFVGAPVCAPSRACLASGRFHDDTGLPQNFHNDYNISIPTFYSVLRAQGYHTMVTGRDDLDKSSGGPGDDGSKHTDELGFSDAIRCDGSTDVTAGGTPHEPFGEWLARFIDACLHMHESVFLFVCLVLVVLVCVDVRVHVRVYVRVRARVFVCMCSLACCCCLLFF